MQVSAKFVASKRRQVERRPALIRDDEHENGSTSSSAKVDNTLEGDAASIVAGLILAASHLVSNWLLRWASQFAVSGSAHTVSN
jgi:hypothetical protein